MLALEQEQGPARDQRQEQLEHADAEAEARDGGDDVAIAESITRPRDIDVVGQVRAIRHHALRHTGRPGRVIDRRCLLRRGGKIEIRVRESSLVVPIGIDDPCRRSGAVARDLASVPALHQYERGSGLVE